MKHAYELLKERKERGFALAKQGKVAQKNGEWIVQSASNPSQTYRVTFTVEGGKCNCQDYLERHLRCKHIFSVQYTLEKTINRNGTITEKRTVRKTYSQNWKAYDLATTQQKELFMTLLNDLCNTIEEPVYTFGRPHFPLRDMVFSSSLKVFSTFSLRRFSTDMKEAEVKGYIQKAPYYSTVARYMEKPEMTMLLHQLIHETALPLKAVEKKFGIDASGFSPSQYSRWFSHKYGKVKDRKLFYKLHLVNGSATHIVTSCEVTTEFVHDSVMLEKLTEETHQDFNMEELSADKGYLSDTNLQHLNRLGIASYVPFKSNSLPNNEKKSAIWRNAYNYFTFNQAQFLEHYSIRSNTETVFHMVKSKFGGYVRSKTETACINEILLKVLCHNICVLISEIFELGIKPEFLGG